MEFNELEEGKVYSAITEGQYNALFIADYYGGDTKRVIFDKEAFDWPFEVDEDDDLPDDSFATDMQPYKYFKWKGEFDRYFNNILKFIFEKDIDV